MWDRRTGEPIAQRHRLAGPPHRGVLRRSCARAGLEPSWCSARPGWCIDPYFSGTKIRWLLDHVPGAHATAAQGELAFGTIDSWLLWKLTGGTRARHRRQQRLAHDAVRHPHNRWDDELLAALHVPASVLPQVRAVEPRVRRDRRSPASARAMPIAGIAGDQQSALFGQACFKPGLAKNTYGTGCFMLMHTGTRFEPAPTGC